MSGLGPPPQRLAVVADAPRIQELMRRSALDLFPNFYDDRQVTSGAIHIAQLDMRLIEDGTDFLLEADGELVACGGWSRRAKLYADAVALEACERAARSDGFQNLVLMATLAGEPLYRAFGFQEAERVDIPLPDGVSTEGVLMERPITPGHR